MKFNDLTDEQASAAVSFASDMEVIESFIGKSGRFVGDTFTIKISEFADVIKKRYKSSKIFHQSVFNGLKDD